MEEKIEEDDGDFFASLRDSNPYRKTLSYIQQLGSPDSSIRNTVRKFSLDESRIPKSFERFNDSPEHDYFSGGYSGATSGGFDLGSASKKQDNGSFLERFPSSSSDDERFPLMEFIGSGGGNGIFKVPIRAAVHPRRPPSLELRPHPLRETQVGSFLRTIACTDTQLWAGHEIGVRFWDFSDVYEAGCGIGGRARRGDEDAAPFSESVQTPSTICLIVDSGSRLIWTGHKDGKIRSWKMDQTLDGSSFREGLSWLAHRGPVLSLVITSYGELWSGSESGDIKIWPWEAIEKSLSLTTEERHMAALYAERSYVDLRSQVTVNGVCSIPASDVKYLLSDNSRGKVWSVSYQSFSLWDARTRELLKVFNVDGQIENRVDISSGLEPIDDEIKMKFVSTSKKEKSQGSISFFQRSRNAILGAADAVRRAASKGAFGDDRKTEAIIQTIDGMIWTGCANGLLVQWDGNGNRLQDFQHQPFSVQCFCTLGSRIWVGYVSGTIQVLDLEGNLLGGWVAHSGPIINMAVGSGYVFTLANHGGIRGWNVTSPGPVDNVLRSELSTRKASYTKLENLKILTGTWNVGQERASHDSLISWLGCAASDVGIVAVGLQEIEMGAGFLAMSAAKETVGLEGSTVGQWWLDMIGKTLDEGSTFERVGSRQLAGLLIAVWARNEVVPHVGDVDVAAVPCGFGRAIGNKGAVGLRMRVYDRIMCFINCHFAAHLEAVNRRNSDFDYVYRTMIFSRQSNLLNATAAGATSAVQLLRVTNPASSQSEDGKPELSEADMVVFLGDLNYRLHGISYDEARDFVSQRCFDWLRERDQLRAEMKAGKVFQGMREGIISFPPTYKFEKQQPGLAGYDSSEKKRIPAWCDRILYRDSRSTSVSECNLECPVVSSISQYEACMDVIDSDHKPVRCIFNIDIAHIDESIRRQEFGLIVRLNEKIKSLLKELHDIPETIVSTNNIILQNQDTSILRVTNKSRKDKATFQITCEGQSTIKEDGQATEHHPRGSFGFPRWLEVIPAAGVIRADQFIEITLHHEEFHTQEEFLDGIPQNWWCVDSRDKEVILLINVRGSRTYDSRTHRIRVRHSLASKNRTTDSKSNNFRDQPNLLQRSNFQPMSSSCDVVKDIRSLHSP